MKSNLVPTLLFAAAGFLIGVSFPVQITPKVFLFSLGDRNYTVSACNILGIFATPFRNISSTVEGASLQQSNATSEKIVPPAKPKGEERLPPNIIVRESDLHLRRLWGYPREDTQPRKYLVVLTVGYSERVNVNATLQKFSDNFDVMLFHYDGRMTEWDEFEWSKQAIHVSARSQAKWWYAKRFMHPSIVAPYEYIFLWDQDLGVEAFEAEEYIKVMKKHGLKISQPGLGSGAMSYDISARRNDTEIHTSTSARRCSSKVQEPPCSRFVEVMAPVFTRDAWTCVWHMIQNDLGHGWGLDWNFWRCVDEPEKQVAVVDSQYVDHHHGFTLGNHGNDTADGSRSKVRARAKAEFGMLKARMQNADRAQAEALLAQSKAAPPS